MKYKLENKFIKQNNLILKNYQPVKNYILRKLLNTTLS